MIYLESHSTDPYFNLALEEYVFEKLDRSQSYFILWQNENTVVVGKYQNTAEEVNQAYIDEHGTRVARRLSGGGAVYHDKGNLNFTFILDQKDVEDFNFKIFVIPVINALKRLGVTAEFNGRNDITIDGMKFSGNSQYSKGGRVLHHGCIMLDSNLELVSNMLKVKEAKFESKSAKSVKSRVTTINAHAPAPITMEQFKQALREEIFQSGQPEELALNGEQLAEITRLRDSKYATWEWVYGASPEYNMRKEKKFPTGLVTLYMQVDGGCIEGIRFYGDFFGNGDISELEAAMKGLRLDSELEEKLLALDVGRYMNGITARDLFELLMY